ncbi:MAG: DUF4157 domain-containing protein [Chloroflexi bacterium]|nr:MAG: DUF4157 domain-containing protein [Chloroflexota bacterium]
MQSHENDLLINPEGRQTPAPRKDEADSSGAEALMHGRTDALTPAAVMHLQKTAGNATVSAALEEQEPSLVKEVVGSGGGAPLDNDTRGFMESRLGADFSDVRVHTDATASESAQAVQAHAYTVGNDVVFQSGKYAPENDSGKRMLAHELTHVVQQRSGPVAGTPAPGGIQISHPSDRFEQAAESSADRVMSSASAAAPTSLGPAPASVQREGEEDEELQGSFVQREAEEDEELQGSFVQREAEDDEELQGSFVQREAEDEEELQGAFVQREAAGQEEQAEA